MAAAGERVGSSPSGMPVSSAPPRATDTGARYFEKLLQSLNVWNHLEARLALVAQNMKERQNEATRRCRGRKEGHGSPPANERLSVTQRSDPNDLAAALHQAGRNARVPALQVDEARLADGRGWCRTGAPAAYARSRGADE